MSSINSSPSSLRLIAISDAPDKPETYLLGQLAQRGHHVTLIAKACPAELLNRVTFIPHIISSRLSFSSIRLIRAECKKAKADIIHSFTARALSNALLATFGLPVKHVAYRGTVGHLSRFDPASWLSFLNPRLNAISCVSHAVERYLIEQGIPSTKLKVIYKGHRLEWYQDVKAIERSSLKIPSDALVVGFLGNMRPVKGADILVNAFSRLQDSQSYLVLIGEVRDSAVQQAIDASPRKDQIRVTGFRSDALAVLASCNLAVCPSREREGFPKAVIEAMALKVPVIVSDAGGCPEMVRDGESGVIVPAGNVTDLASALSRGLSNTAGRVQFAQKAYEQLSQRFNADATVEQTEALYRKLVSNTQ